MNVQILYATMTGHSKKIAHRIADEIGAPTHDLKKNPKIPPCDLLFIVSGIYGGESKQELLNYVKQLSPSQIKKVALLTSSTRNIAQGSLRQTLTDVGLNLVGKEFLCQGSFLFKAMGHPNKAEITSALEFVRKQIKETQNA
ncbi:flavodoxin domain-containing protein [Oscillospiraceae bacterium LTW-04]|nr:flavodoxin domain-containing protein [Oscillospiraceae bacterium MB24-C1]